MAHTLKDRYSLQGGKILLSLPASLLVHLFRNLLTTQVGPSLVMGIWWRTTCSIWASFCRREQCADGALNLVSGRRSCVCASGSTLEALFQYTLESRSRHMGCTACRCIDEPQAPFYDNTYYLADSTRNSLWREGMYDPYLYGTSLGFSAYAGGTRLSFTARLFAQADPKSQ